MTIDEFSKVELRVAKVLAAERVPASDKLVKLQISVGESERQLVAGIGKSYTPEALIGKEIVIVANLDPRKFKIKLPVAEGEESQTLGLESQGMLLAAHAEDGAPILLTPDREAPPGSSIG
jgi:methionyl-tRNA synthetase